MFDILPQAVGMKNAYVEQTDARSAQMCFIITLLTELLRRNDIMDYKWTDCIRYIFKRL